MSTVNESILVTVKRMQIGIGEDDLNFDPILIPFINSALNMCWMVGIGKRGFKITGETETWEDFIGADFADFEMVKEYISLRVKLLFDPPTSGSAMKAMESKVAQIEYYLNTLEAASHASSKKSDSEDTEDSD